MIKPENLLLIDIETVPLYKNYQQLNEKLQRLWDKKSLTLDKDNLNTAATFSEKAGIYAEYGKIVCIGLGYFVKSNERYSLKVKTLAGHDEKKLLEDFRQVCNKFFKQFPNSC